MITVDEALQHVLSHSHSRNTIRVSVQDALGAVLAEEVFSDIDSPPHDKAMMDGYAIAASDLSDASDAAIDLEIIEEVTAGDVPTKSLSPGQAVPQASSAACTRPEQSMPNRLLPPQR